MPFIEKYLGEFEHKGGKDVKVKICPYCGSDDYKFLINPTTGKWICNHRNRCGEQGGINKLKLKFGIKVSFSEMMQKPDNGDCLVFDAAKQKEFTFLKKEQLDYFKKRGISEKTLKENRVCNFKNGIIAFPYFKDNNLMTFKYRSLDKKFFQEGNKPVLMGMDDVDTEKALIICEGEIDMLSFRECGVNNSVSIPFGANDMRWIEYNYEYLNKFKEIILCLDNDKAGQEAEKQVITRLGIEKLKKINLGTYKDINEVLMQEGEGEVLRLLFAAENYDMGGCYDVSDISITDDEDCYASFEAIDDILHGFRKKELTVWTGVPGSGKSTILNQITLQTIEQGGKVAIFSGEISKEQLLKWAMIQYYGWESCEEKQFKVGTGKYYEPKKQYEAEFKQKFKGKLFILEEETTMTDEKLFEKMKYLQFKFGVSRFIFDNLMQLDLGSKGDKYENQKKFIGNCVIFAKKNNCHIDLVAHPKKPTKGEMPTMYDISGASEIPNLAFNIIMLNKLEPEKAEEFAMDRNLNFIPSTAAMILKHRTYGIMGTAFLGFDSRSKRFYSNDAEKNKKYDVEKMENKQIKEFIDFFEGEIVWQN